MNVFMLKRVYFSTMLLLLTISTCVQQPVFASPYGTGVFGADVPFSGSTAISISIDKDPTILTTYSNGLYTGSDSHTVTVTSTDVVGYNLYIEDQTTTNMTNGPDTIPTSANSVPAPLATNSWGYNTVQSSTNFVRMPDNQTLIKSADGPYKNGDGITVTYGVKLDATKRSGVYTTGVTYTAIGKS